MKRQLIEVSDGEEFTIRSRDGLGRTFLFSVQRADNQIQVLAEPAVLPPRGQKATHEFRICKGETCSLQGGGLLRYVGKTRSRGFILSLKSDTHELVQDVPAEVGC